MLSPSTRKANVPGAGDGRPGSCKYSTTPSAVGSDNWMSMAAESRGRSGSAAGSATFSSAVRSRAVPASVRWIN